MNDIKYTVRVACGVCEMPFSKPVMYLPKFPLTELFVNEKPEKLSGYLDQEFHICSNCGHGQLSNVIAPEQLYSPSAYFFRTSTSTSASKCNDFFLSFIKKVVDNKKFISAVEIGCSDLYLLKQLSFCTQKFIGIDPILKGKEKEFSEENVFVYGDLYEHIAEDISLKDSLVISSHTVEHIENPKKMFKKMIEKSSDETVFIHQFPSLEYLIDDARFDQVFHQHLNYFSLNSVKYMLNEIGAELVDYTFNPRHWGSLLIAFKKSKKQNILSKTDLINYGLIRAKKEHAHFCNIMNFTKDQLEQIKSPVYIFGAALMLPILSYYLKNDFSLIIAIVDDDSSKKGRYYINLKTQIINTSDISSFEDAVILLGILNHSRRVMKRIIELNPKKIIIPIQTM
ncbi:class I SAM-dependent methyltransferase [Candidatus Woesearchaeota archaeon]|nr:class I SAM-dependent methyltransferase [Candidatus Woesearchaeota archaeon]MCF7900812.1 class I SAM-dependent methyltransferase [Candidatus Woesearchaeota archaeon]MCF8013114.1 class I SAM-dependent methyltransferase [Candidatus Woesearchaeota archaeon]